MTVLALVLSIWSLLLSISTRRSIIRMIQQKYPRR